jgi:GNAT superfamily N-acetyltransferase
MTALVYDGADPGRAVTEPVVTSVAMSKQGPTRIRRAREADAGEVGACVERAYTRYVARMGIMPAPALDDYARVIREREVWVAEVDGTLAGVLVLAETSEGFLLDNVAVDPPYQQRGLGRLLREFAEERAAKSGHGSIYLYANVAMTENIASYVRHGYVEYDRRVEGPYARVYLRKTLEKSGR